MIPRVARLVRAEALKLSSHPFLYVALALVAASALGAGLLQPRLRQQEETVWQAYHSVQLFAYAFKWGLQIATYVLLVFASMLFAGEFDRGTIKNLLTRPITRADLFAAKCVTLAGLAGLLLGFALYVSLLYAFARGEAGPVWAGDQYGILRSWEEIRGHAVRAVGMSIPGFLAAGFLGLLISNWTESSGYAVAIALVLYLFSDFLTGMLSERLQQKTFLYYAPYALGKLQALAEGTTTRWSPEVVDGRLHLWVPAAYVAAFVPAAFAVFRARNVSA